MTDLAVKHCQAGGSGVGVDSAFSLVSAEAFSYTVTVVEFFTGVQQFFYSFILSGLGSALILSPLWVMGAIGILCKSHFGHVFPLTIIVWVVLTLYIGIDWWLYKFA